VGFSYSYTRVNPDGILSGANADGGYGYVEYNFNKVLGLVADLGANHAGNAGGNLNFVQNNLRYSAGVVFRFGSK
jgi:hypothetical protein